MLRFIVTIILMLAVPTQCCTLMAAPPAKTASTKKKSSTTSKTSSSKPKSSSTSKSKKSSAKKSAAAKQTSKPRTAAEVKKAKEQNAGERRKTQGKIAANTRETEKQLNKLNLLGGEITNCTTSIAALQYEADSLQACINAATDSIEALNTRLAIITEKYVSAVRKTQLTRSQVSELAFVFSANSFEKAWRRSQSLRQFEKWRDAKSKEIAQMKAEIDQRLSQLSVMQQSLNTKLSRLVNQKNTLETKKKETTAIVDRLKREGSQLKAIMQRQQKEAAALDAELDRIIAEETRRQEEQRRREEEHRRQEAARKAATAASASSSSASSASSASTSGSKPAANTSQSLHTASGGESGVAPATPPPVGGNFGDYKGRLPFPVSGKYTIVKRFGRHKHPTLPHIETTNSGIDLETASGATVKSVFDGEVSAVFRPDGYNNVVVIRHGNYMTVYANLGSLSVSSGQKVKAGQSIGTVYIDRQDSNRSILHFEIRHKREKLDPELWLKK